MVEAKPYTPNNSIRIVTAASLFDGHDVSINIMRRILQSTGAEVIHLGHDRSAEEVVNTAIQEDANAIAMTSYQGGHMEYFKYMYDLLKERGGEHIKIFAGGGGTILPVEIQELENYGVTKIYHPDDGRSMGLQGMINDLLQRSDFPIGEEIENALEGVFQADSKSIGRLISCAENFPRLFSKFSSKIEEKITEKTKAIFLIHILGYACDMDKYASFCSTNKLTLMEDCCESFGAFHNQKSVGRFGVGGTFSHFFSHHLTTMEGGTIITDDDELVNDLRSMRAHGWTRNRTDANKISKKFPDLDPRFLFLIPGFNVRPMEIQAAVGLVQLKRINELLDFRMKFAKFIIDVFKPISWIKIVGSNRVSLAQSHVDRSHSWMNIPFTLEDDAPQVVNVIKDIFENHGVETRPIITGNFMMQPAASYLGSQGYFPNAQEISERGFMIGCHAMEVSEDLQATIQNIVKALQNL